MYIIICDYIVNFIVHFSCVSVTFFQILTQSVFLLLAQTRTAEQTEQSEDQTQAVEYTCISQSLAGASVHVYDSRSVRKTARTRPTI